LRDDLDNLPAAGAKARGVDETARELYRHLGVDLEGFGEGQFHSHLGAKMLARHGGDEAAALAAIKKEEKRIGAWLKARGVDFPYEELLDYVDETRPLKRGEAAMDLAVRLARGDDFQAISNALQTGHEAAIIAHRAARKEEFLMFRDFVGSLSARKYGEGHSAGYYRRGMPLFKSGVGEIYDRHLSEGFANYVEMRYDPDPRSRIRLRLAERMFPATTRRFGEILDEIGNGEHAYKSGRDHAAENTLDTRKPNQ